MGMMMVDNKYNYGDTVYIITDRDQFARQVTGIRLTPGSIIYQLSCGPATSEHYEFEISTEKNYVTA